MSELNDHFPTTMAKELLGLVKGKRLGSGAGREVFVYDPDPTCVIKFEIGACSFQNVTEWQTWQDFREAPKVARWLAPCIMISPCGSIMIQKRTSLIRREELPEKVPGWATDTKVGNWGLLDGKPVMHDYGIVLQTLNDRPKKADWWGFEE